MLILFFACSEPAPTPLLEEVAALQEQVDTLEALLWAQRTSGSDQLHALGERVEDLEDELDLITTHVRVDTDTQTVRIVEANLYVQSGSGFTDDEGEPWGLGNLILGYDQGQGAHTGSHSLVVGDVHAWSGTACVYEDPYATCD